MARSRRGGPGPRLTEGSAPGPWIAAGRYTGVVKRVAWIVAGWALVALGVAGLFLPFLQGIVLIALGLAVLSRHSVLVRRWIERARRAFPALDRVLRRAGTDSETNGERGPESGGPPGPGDHSAGIAGTKIGSPEASSTTEP